jgi:hypothetical protein
MAKKKTVKRRKVKRDPNFKLSAKQKKNLPLSLQRAILKYHKGK